MRKLLIHRMSYTRVRLELSDGVLAREARHAREQQEKTLLEPLDMQTPPSLSTPQSHMTQRQ